MAADAVNAGSSPAHTPILRMAIGWLPANTVDFPGKQPFLFLCMRSAIYLVIFILVDGFIMRATHLSSAGYEQPFLLVAVLENLGLAFSLR